MRFRFGIALLLVFALFASVSFASEKHLSTDNYFNGETIIANDKQLTVYLAEDMTQILVLFETFPYVIDKGACEEIGEIKICFDDVKWDKDKLDYYMIISTYSLEPELELTVSPSSATVNVEGEFKFTGTIKNNGKNSVEVTVDHDFTSDFEITDTGGIAEPRGTRLYFKETLKENQVETFDFTLKPMKSVERSFTLRGDYKVNDVKKEVYSNTFSIKSSPILSFNVYFNDTKIKLGANTTLIIKINNSKEDDINLDYVDIYLPDGLKFIETTSIRVPKNSTDTKAVGKVSLTNLGNNTYRYTGRVREISTGVEDNSTYIVMKVRGIYAGSSDALVKSKYSYEEKTHYENLKDNVEVENDGIKIIKNFVDGQNFDSSQIFYFKIEVLNSNEFVKISNLTARFDTELFNISPVTLVDLDDTRSKYILLGEQQLPEANSDKIYVFKIKIKYETEFGEKFEYLEDYDIDMKKIQELALTHTISDTDLLSGDEFYVTTEVENKRNVYLTNVRVYDEVSPLFQKVGVLSTGTELPKLGKIEAYKYKLIAPDVDKDTVFNIKSIARYDDGALTYEYTKEDTVTVKPKIGELTVSTNIPQSPIFAGQIINVDYTITNGKDEPYTNITLHFPVQQVFDTIGETSYFIPNLNPDDSVTIKDKHRLRAKKNETQDPDDTLITFYDKRGKIVNQTVGISSFEVRYSYIARPAFIIEKRAKNKTITEGDPVDVVLTVRNVGKEKASINLEDSLKKWTVTVAPESLEKVEYSITPSGVGIINLGKATGKYVVMGEDATTVSEDEKITINKKIIQNITAAPVQENVSEKNVSETKAPETSKSWWDKIIGILDTIGNMFKR